MSGPDIQPIAHDAALMPFIEAAGKGVLLLRRCHDCLTYAGPDTAQCAGCASLALEWVESEGSGVLDTWTVTYDPGPDGCTPVRHVAGIVELAEGPWLDVAVLVDDPDTLSSGRQVVITFPAEPGAPIPTVRL